MPMKMTELLRYDVPPEIIRLWQEQESEVLLPLQELAIKQHALFEGKNLLIQAPTTSGKTFIGEMAVIQTALRRKKVVYLVPLKALAQEKWADFQKKYAPYGLHVIISTRDHREFDADLEKGNFSVAVVVYEKLAQLLVRRPERLEEVELVVADELEILSDPDRGALVEMLLTRMLWDRATAPDNRGAPPSPGTRLIGLSAVIGHADKLAQWMEADLVSFERRPVELRYGVLHEGRFRYRSYNDYSEAEEELAGCISESTGEILLENVVTLVQRGEPCLVFVKDKWESRRVAEFLAQRLDLPPASDAVEALRDLESTHSCEQLEELLGHGVAFHNADLSPDERRIVEDAFRAEAIQAMISTSTLAAGMNLPAQNVFISTDKWQYDDRFGMPWKSPILRSEYENMGGRAGRYGSGKAFGRSILVAATPFDHETLWRRYVEGEREHVKPQLARASLEEHILRLVASCSCRTEQELLSFLERTPTGQWIWAEYLTVEETEFHVRAALNRAVDAGTITSGPAGRLEVTPFGWAVASKGITLATAQELAAWVRESEPRWERSHVSGQATESGSSWDLDVILVAALTPDGRMVQVSLTAQEYDRADYPGQLKRLTRDEDLSADVPLNRIRNCALIPFFEEVRAIKIALFLREWIHETPVYELEERYRTFFGQILAASEQIGWLIDATAAVAEAFGAQTAFVEWLNRLSERVARGLQEPSLPLARLKSSTLGRKAIIALAARGLTNAATVAETALDLLKHWMPVREAKLLKAWASSQAPPSSPDPSEPPRAASPPSPVLIVNDKHPDRIHVDGRPVLLQDKQYRLIRVLAESPGECVPYQCIYRGVWGEDIVEPGQVHFQKRRLLERIEKAAPERSNLVRTIMKRGFVLDLAADEVAVLTVPVSSVV